MRVVIRVLLIVLALTFVSTENASAADVVEVPRQVSEQNPQDPALIASDQLRASPYNGTVKTETFSGRGRIAGGGAVATTTTLSPEMIDALNFVCNRNNAVFKEPTYVPACEQLAVPTPRPIGNGTPVATEADNEKIANDYVLAYLRLLPLGKATATMSSPDGVCGAVHYTNLGFAPERIFEDPSAPSGTLRVHAYAKTVVDWGDNNTNTYYTSGKPGIDSEISHFWEDKGTYAITATTTWSAAWTLGPYSGVVTTTPVTTTTSPWRVVDLQAVITEG